MYRKFNTARASLVRMRNKSRSPSRFISARRASFVRGAPAPPPPQPRTSGRGLGPTRETALPLPPRPSKQKSPRDFGKLHVIISSSLSSCVSPLSRTVPSPINPHARTHALAQTHTHMHTHAHKTFASYKRTYLYTSYVISNTVPPSSSLYNT